ncbi:MAG TPA: mannose-6-phosphate isomerase [Planctomycetaceae bacterium]|nr:mannose-6-phosphate isomerase [Planctomycetaceae bacterium]
MNNSTTPSPTLGPLTFQPLFRRALWGGTRLASLLNKDSGHLGDCSESWEIVDLDDDQSVVNAGPWSGWTLRQLVQEQGKALLGRHAPRDTFPLLLKFLDATRPLSLQVHPDATTAARHAPDCHSKTEAWIILATKPGSRLWVGLEPGTTSDQLTTALAENNIDCCVTSFEPAVGQCVVVPAGTIHAIGEGIVLAEIQQSSDTTYRLYDWGRTDSDGTPRRVDLQRGLEAIHFDAAPIVTSPPAPANPTQPVPLVDRREFQVVQHHISGSTSLNNDDRCRILTAIDGTGSLETNDDRIDLTTGQTVLIPAAVQAIRLDSSNGMTLLDCHLP